MVEGKTLYGSVQKVKIVCGCVCDKLFHFKLIHKCIYSTLHIRFHICIRYSFWYYDRECVRALVKLFRGFMCVIWQFFLSHNFVNNIQFT